MIKNYVLIAIRNILRNRTISFINIFGLAVSMSVCMLLILIVADQYSYDGFHKKKDRIYRVITDRTEQREHKWSTATAPFPLADEIKHHVSVEKMAVIERGFEGIAGWKDQEIPFHGYFTNNDFLSIFDFPLEKGNPAEALTLPNAIVISQKLSIKLFGDTDPLNEVINIEGIGGFVVTGVFKTFPGKTHLDFEALASINFLNALKRDSALQGRIDDWNNIYDSYIYFLVKDGAEASEVIPLLKQAASNNYDPKGKFEYEFLLQPLTGITPGPLLSNTTGFGLPSFMIYIMLGIALVVLCSACFNYANLTTARAVNRAKEIGVRKVVGARNKHVFVQFMVEAVIMSLFAFIFADTVVQFILPRMNNFFVSMGAPIGFNETRYLYMWFLAFVLLTGALAGIVPAFFFSATHPIEALKKSIRLDRLGRRFGFKRLDIRKVLVVVQFAFTIFFTITIVTIYQQTQFVLTTDHGFKKDNIVNVRLQGLEYGKISAEFEKLADVRTVAAATHLPALGTNNTVSVKLPNEEEPVNMSFFGVDQHYIQSLGLELLAGKNFPGTMPKEERYVIINEKAVTRFGLKSPQNAIGQLLQLDDKQLEVIGVVKDFHYERLDEEIGPMALRYLPQMANSAIVVINQGKSKEVISELKKTWGNLTNRPFDYTFFKDDLRISYGHFEALLMVLGYVTIITVSIACLGLLGMVIYHVQNKTKEIGIRKTLGAEAFQLLSTVGKSFFIMILIAYAIGGPLAYVVNNGWLQTNAYRIDFGLPTLMLGFALVLVMVAITIGAQLYKAIKVNPAEHLRSE